MVAFCWKDFVILKTDKTTLQFQCISFIVHDSFITVYVNSLFLFYSNFFLFLFFFFFFYTMSCILHNLSSSSVFFLFLLLNLSFSFSSSFFFLFFFLHFSISSSSFLLLHLSAFSFSSVFSPTSAIPPCLCVHPSQAQSQDGVRIRSFPFAYLKREGNRVCWLVLRSGQLSVFRSSCKGKVFQFLSFLSA